jgi:hypothetical protein
MAGTYFPTHIGTISTLEGLKEPYFQNVGLLRMLERNGFGSIAKAAGRE